MYLRNSLTCLWVYTLSFDSWIFIFFRLVLFFIKNIEVHSVRERSHDYFTCAFHQRLLTRLFLLFLCWSVHRLQCGQLCQCVQSCAMWGQTTALLVRPHFSPCLRHDILLLIIADVRPSGPRFLEILLPLYPPSPCRRTGVAEFMLPYLDLNFCFFHWAIFPASPNCFITTASSTIWSHSSWFCFSFPWTAKNYYFFFNTESHFNTVLGAYSFRSHYLSFVWGLYGFGS